MRKQFSFQGEKIRTNYALAQKTVELAEKDELLAFYAFVDEYTKFNSNGVDNLVSQVGYCLGSEEVQIVQRAARRYKEVFQCAG